MSIPRRKQRLREALIAHLLVEKTQAEAASRAGVSVPTLTRWLRDADFQRDYRAARRAVVEAAIARAQRGTQAAVEALEKNLACGIPGIEIKAAVAILDKAIAGVELIDLEERIANLEAAQQAGKDGNR